MSVQRAALYPVSLCVLLLASACASTGASDSTASAEAALQAAYEQELAPATPEEIAEVQRADALTRANFWAGEFRKDPTNLETTIQFTRVLREIGSHERAIDVLSGAIPAHPQSAELQLIMGRALMSEGRIGEAAESFFQASVIAPQDATAHAALGLALDRLERHRDAQTSYLRALELDPARASTLANYGLSLALTGDLAGAEAQLRKAYDLPDADGRVRQNLALILGLQGEFDAMRAADPHAPTRTMEANVTTIRGLLAPARNYEALVMDGADTPAPQIQPVPEQREPERRGVPQLRGSLSSR